MSDCRPFSRCLPSPGRGFTLVEVVVTAAIIAVLALIALPRFDRSADRRRVEAAAQKLVADLDWARTAARARGAATSVQFNPEASDDNGWLLRGALPTDVNLRLAGAPFRSAVTALNLMDADGNAVDTISFHPLGIPSASGKILLKSGQVVLTVRIESPAGAVWIER